MQALSFFKNFKEFIYLFLERGREWKREGEKHQCVVPSHAIPTGDLAHNPVICPDWELNQWPFGSQAGIQPSKPHKTQQEMFFFVGEYISGIGKMVTKNNKRYSFCPGRCSSVDWVWVCEPKGHWF